MNNRDIPFIFIKKASLFIIVTGIQARFDVNQFILC